MPTALERLTGYVAIMGGLLALGVAALVSASVLGRWLFSAPIDGDFEFVKIATAIGVFAYLPYAQARRGNIMVDTFTGRLSLQACARIDAFWDVAYAIFMGFCAFALFVGTADYFKSGETTMQRQLLMWPSIGLSAVLCVLLSITAISSAIRLVQPTFRGDKS